MTGSGAELPAADRAVSAEQPPPGPLLRLIRDQRVAFLLVGGLNTAVGFGGFLFFSRFIHFWGGDGAVLAAQLIAIPFAFVLHRRFVFRVTGHVARDLGRFLLVNVIPVGTNLAVLPVLTKLFGWPQLPAQLAFTVAWVVASFFLHRGFSFRRTAAEHTGSDGSPDGGSDSPSDSGKGGKS